jgi:uncharacterized protein YbjT (DUF2867 family)
MSTFEVTTPIAVIGATGQQGSATVDALLEWGMPVRALTRDMDSPAAHALSARGVEVVTADLDAPESVHAAFAGAAAAFAMTTFDGPRGIDGEISHGKVIADCARAAQLPFLVYSSVGGAERKSGVPQFESKRRVEEFLADAVPVNFLRPTFFMENLLPSMITREGNELVVRIPMPGDVALQMISVRDVGKAAAALLISRNPDTAPIEIVGDDVTGERIAELVSQRAGAPARFAQLPLEVLGSDHDLRTMFEWLADPPSYRADFARTSALVPGVDDLQQWLQRRTDFD